METTSGSRWRVLLVVAGLAVGTLALKAAQDGWLSARPPLEVDGQPALIFFTLDRGCECQMQVVHRAETQLAAWQVPTALGLNVIHVDFYRRPDLAEHYAVARAPALVLLDNHGEVVWKQDLALSDVAPLDLSQAQWQIEALVADAARK
jgi:hypothetical protein